jgi:filamentous hemagglutinin family protein
MNKINNLLQILFGCFFLIFFNNTAKAQITPDNTLGAETSRLTPNVLINGTNADRIDGGAVRGINLFHSFSEFNIDDGQRVYFGNPSGVENIFSRLTGNSASDIFGVLGVDGNANLFLINPNGILFGENSSLDVGGSFVGTTANQVGFGEQGVFSASNPQAPPLLTIEPNLLRFNRFNRNAAIQNNSRVFAGQNLSGGNAFGLRVPDGKSLLLLGGNVSMDGGGLNAFGGRIELGGLAEAGTVGLDIDGDIFDLVFPDAVERANIFLTNNSRIDTIASDGGSIALNARDANISDVSLIITGIGENLGSADSQAGDINVDATGEININSSAILNLLITDAQGNGGDININAGSFNLENGAEVTSSTFGQGNAGNVSIITGSLFTNNRAEITTTTSGLGDAGNINIYARDTVSFDGKTLLFSLVDATGEGEAGKVNIDANNLLVKNGSQLSASSFGRGDAGSVSINARDTASFDGATTAAFSILGAGAVGKGGDINISTGSLSVTNGAFLSSSTLGQGDAGVVSIDARDQVIFDGVGTNGLNSAARSLVLSGAVGNGGEIRINTGLLSLTNGADLEVSTAGKGNAGNIIINVRDTVSFDGISTNGINSAARSRVTRTAEGSGGNIIVNAGSLNLRDSAQLVSLTTGKGNAGNVTINVSGLVDIVGVENGFPSGILSGVGTGVKGNGGDITVNAGSVNLRDGAQLISSTSGKGNAGNVNINVSGIVDITGVKNEFASGIRSGVGTGAEGNGGNITVDAGSVNLRDGAQLISSTSGKGNAGNVTLTAKDTVSFTGGNIFSRVRAGGMGKGGNININAANLSIRDGSQLLTDTDGASDSQMVGKSDAGNVTINVSGLVDIFGVEDEIASGIFSGVETGTEGNGGDITVNAGSFKLRDGAQLITSTSGKGNAGNVTLTAKNEVLISGDSKINSDAKFSAIGNGADINIKAQNINIINDAEVDTNSFGQGNSGNIQIKADDSVFILSGARLSSATFGQGKAGNIDVEVGNLAYLDGFEEDRGRSGIYSVVGPSLPTLEFPIERTGGNVAIKVGSLRMTNGAIVSTSALGPGKAGNISIDTSESLAISGKKGGFESGLYVNSDSLSGTSGNVTVNSPRITLDDQGILTAESTSGNGGNINLISDLLLMRRQAQISTNAGTAQQSGDGGNININSTFVTAIPGENSDITTNSFAGKGGRIDVTAQGIFGLEIRDRLTPLSDITAFSELSPTFNGEIILNTPNVDPSQGTIELPQTIIDPDALIAQNPCLQRGGSEFIVTGKGGLPVNPNQMLNADAVEIDLVETAPLTITEKQALNNNFNDILNQKNVPINNKILPAQGWVVSGDEVILTAYAANGKQIQRQEDNFSACRTK